VSDRVVFEFEKNAKERVWYDCDQNDANGKPVYRPSRKGITLARKTLPALLEAVQALVDEASEAA
jgi:hypothetical protein